MAKDSKWQSFLAEIAQYDSGSKIITPTLDPLFPGHADRSQRLDVLKRARTVLIIGERGSGKEFLMQRFVREVLEHKHEIPSESRINCAGLDETLARSALFGHVKGAFTGACTSRPVPLWRCAPRKVLLDQIEDKKRVAEYLDEAEPCPALFLDEIHRLPETIQGSLLRCMEYGEIHPLGTNPIRLDKDKMPTLIAATQPAGIDSILNDLLDRFALRLGVLCLREYPFDIPRLAALFLYQRFRDTALLDKAGMSEFELLALCADRWKGNVRELRNAIDTAELNGVRVCPSPCDNLPAVFERMYPKYDRCKPPFLRLDEIWRFDLRPYIKQVDTIDKHCTHASWRTPAQYYAEIDAEQERERQDRELTERAQRSATFIVRRDKFERDMSAHPLPQSLKEWEPVERQFTELLGRKHGIIEAAAVKYYRVARATLSRKLSSLGYKGR